MKQKGFTLIELLAVIVILAIIALIATPIIIGLINDARKQSNDRSAELYMNGVEQAIMRKNMTDRLVNSTCLVKEDGNLDCDGIDVLVDVANTKATDGIITIENGMIVKVEQLQVGDSFYDKENGGKLTKVDYDPSKYTDESCFTYTTKKVESYDINYDTCMVVVAQAGQSMGAGWDNDDINSLCTGGEADDLTLDDALSLPQYLESFTNYGAVTNVVTKDMDGVSITGYTCGEKDVAIPKMINGKKVIDIALMSFMNKQLTSVTIPNSVKSIGGLAFLNNKLTSVIIPSGVKSISTSSFSENQLVQVIIPNGVTSIKKWAFSGNNLTSINIPNNTITIGNGAFNDNPNLTSIKIDNNVGSISGSPWGASNATITYLR